MSKGEKAKYIRFDGGVQFGTTMLNSVDAIKHKANKVSMEQVPTGAFITFDGRRFFVPNHKIQFTELEITAEK